MRRLVLAVVTTAILLATGHVRSVEAAVPSGVVAAAAVPSVVAPVADPHVHTVAASVYEAHPDKGFIAVTVTLKITNVDAPAPVTTAHLLVDTGSTNLVITTGGHAVARKERAPTDFQRHFDLAVPVIARGKTRTITATYRIVAGAPRSDFGVRLNAAYLDFWGSAQVADASSVTIVVPQTFQAQVSDESASETIYHGMQTFESGPIADPSTYFMEAYGSDPAGDVVDNVMSRTGHAMVIRSWPGDDTWREAVRRDALADLPKLEALIGVRLPGGGPITIREVADYDLGNYAGEFDRLTRTARLSEYNDSPGLVAHELAHAWFNPAVFDWDWQMEGYASWAESVDPASRPCVAPSSYPGTGRPNLGDWQYAESRATDQELAVIDYQYATACSIISTIAGEIGEGRIRDILAVETGPAAAYAGITDADAVRTGGWRGWLDAVDELGMRPAGLDDTHTVADRLVAVGIATETDLEGRAAMRAALDAFRAKAKGDGLAVPLAVVAPMAVWDFQSAQAALTEASAIADAREQVAALLPGLDRSKDPLAEGLASAVDLVDLQNVQRYANGQLEAAKALAAVLPRAAVSPGPLEQIGLIGVDVPGSLQVARVAVAGVDLITARGQTSLVADALANATVTGLLRVLLVVFGGFGAVVFVIRLHRRALRDAAAALEYGAGSADGVQPPRVSMWTPPRP